MLKKILSSALFEWEGSAGNTGPSIFEVGLGASCCPLVGENYISVLCQIKPHIYSTVFIIFRLFWHQTEIYVILKRKFYNCSFFIALTIIVYVNLFY